MNAFNSETEHKTTSIKTGLVMSLVFHVIVLVPAFYYGSQLLRENKLGDQSAQALDVALFYQQVKPEIDRELNNIAENNVLEKSVLDKDVLKADSSSEKFEHENQKENAGQPESSSVSAPEPQEQKLQDAGLINSAEKAYLFELMLAIEKKKSYPSRALKRDIRGTVKVFFIIQADGGFEKIAIHKTSGSAMLDESAVGFIKLMAGFKPLPQELNREQWEIIVPIQYQIQ